MSGHSELNQPFNTIPTMNQTFPAGTGTEGYYRIIDDAFSPASEHDTVFITDRHDRDRIRQRAYQREERERQRMADELRKDSLFSDGQARDSYNTYLNSETDRIATNSRQRHLEKLERERHARWFDYDRKGETSNSVLEDLRRECSPFPQTEPVDDSSNSLLDSYKASMKEGKGKYRSHGERTLNFKKGKRGLCSYV